MAKFDLIVEGDSSIDPTIVAEHKLELKGLVWNGDSPPDIVMLENIALVKVGKYLSPGDKYCYRIAVLAKLVNGNLV